MFGAGVTVLRDRRPMVEDPYNPARTVQGEWEAAETVTITGAYVDLVSSTSPPDGARTSTESRYVLYLNNPAADVVKGDRIRVGDLTLYVNDVPHSPRNPFTGWQPVRVVPLDHTLG